ncbi:MAG: hypothetical protein ACKOOL_13780 [Novosphingobium sp.]
MSADIVARGMAAAQARSGNSAALVNAIRNNGFFPGPASRLVANDTPAIVVGGAGVGSTINANAAVNPAVLANDSRIKWLSGPTTPDGSGTWLPRGAWYGASRTTQYAALEFVHTGTSFEFSCLGSFNVGSNNLRVVVNDAAVAPFTVAAGDGQYHYVKFTFPVSGTRRIRIEGAGGKFRGVNVASPSEISGTGRNYPLISVMGDSFAEGTGAALAQDGEAISLVRALGGNIALGGVGGTGILNPGTGGKVAWTDATRMTDLTMVGAIDSAQGVSTVPALGIVMMSINDQGLASSVWSPFGSSFQAAVNNRCWALIDGWQAANPGKPLIFFGPTWPSGDPVPDIFRIRDATQEACWGAARSNVWFIDRLAPLPALRNGANSFISTTGTTTNASASITAIPSTTGIVQGAGVEGNGITAGARVASIVSSTAITIDPPATATGTAVALTFRNTQSSLYGFGSADGTHPGQAGHNLDALWMAREARRLILTEFT